MPILDRLLYDSGISTEGFRASGNEIKRQLREIGETATKTFERDIQTRLAKSIDPKNFSSDFEKAKQVIKNFGISTTDVFDKQIGRTLSKGFFDANKEAQGFFSSLLSGSGTLSRFGSVASGVGVGILGAELVKGLTNAGTAAAKFAADFDLALTRVQTIAGKDFNFNAVADQIKSLSVSITQDVLTLTSGLADIIGSGFDKATESLQILEVSAKAAVGGFTDTATAASGIVTVLNAFGLAAEESSKVSDILFKTVDEGVISFGDLSTQIGEVATPAKLAGISLEDVGAAIAATTRAGINASETMTGLKNAIVSIISPTEGAAKAAKQLGLDFSQAGIQAAGGFNEFVKLIAEVTKGDIKTLRTLFPETRAMREIAILAGSMSSEFQVLAKSFSDTAETAGAADRAFQLVNQTASKQAELLKNNLAVAVLDAGTKILNDLLPAIQNLNDFFSNTTPLEKTIRNLQLLGVATKDIKELQSIANVDKISSEIDQLKSDIDDLTKSNKLLNESFFDIRTALSQIFVKDITTVGDFAKQIKDILNTTGGEEEINKRIAASRERLRDLTLQYKEVLLGLRQGDADELSKAIKNEGTRLSVMGQLLGVYKEVVEKQKESHNEELKALGIMKERQDVPLPPIISPKTPEDLEKARKEAEKMAEAVVKARNQLELLSAGSDIERQLIAIRQKAEEQRKSNAENLAAIKLINATERAEIAKTIDKIIDFDKRILQISKSFLKQVELKIIPEIQVKLEQGTVNAQAIQDLFDKITQELASGRPNLRHIQDTFDQITEALARGDVNLPDIVKLSNSITDALANGRIDPIAMQRLNDKITEALSQGEIKVTGGVQNFSDDVRKALEGINEPIEDFINSLEDQRIATGEELVSLAGLIDSGLGNIAASILNFQKIISSQQSTGLGGVLAGVGVLQAAIPVVSKLFGSLFGSGEKARKAEEAQRRQQEASARSAAAAQRAADALENLRRAADDFSAGELSTRIQKLNDEFLTITNTTKQLTDEEQKLAIETLSRLQVVRNAITGLEQEKRTTTDPERLRQIEEELAQLGEEADNLENTLLGLDIASGNVTASELERLKVLLQEKGILEDSVKRFQAFDDGLRGLIDRLQFGFEILGNIDPQTKLDELVKAITTTFGFAIPERFKSLQEFILASVDALKAGGQSLIDFLIESGLEELTAEEFADLIKLLDQFSDDIASETQDVADALAEFLDALNIQFNILDIDDPTEKLKLFRQAVIDTFGATLPDSFEGLKNFVLQGFDLLKGDAEVLKAALAGLGLEELDAEQFKQLLLELEGLLDAIESRFSVLTQRLNLQFDLLNIDDVGEKFKRLSEAISQEFGGIVPALGDDLEKFIQQGVDALLQGGEAFDNFKAAFGLEELSTEELEQLLRMLRDLQDEAKNTSGEIEKITDKLADFNKGFDLLADILDIEDPAELLNNFRNGINTLFTATIPESFADMKKFVLEGFLALQGDAEALKIFLEKFGLEELTREQFEQLLRDIENGLDALVKPFDDLISDLNLEFDLLDVNDPVEKLAKLRQGILKEFGAIIPETDEGIRDLISRGTQALIAGGDALKAFLKSIDLEELTADQFENFLKFLKGIADEAQKKVDEIGGNEEAVTSVVKSITFQQANVMLNELATIREILTQMLDEIREDNFSTAGGTNFFERRVTDRLDEMIEQQIGTSFLIEIGTTQILVKLDAIITSLSPLEEIASGISSIGNIVRLVFSQFVGVVGGLEEFLGGITGDNSELLKNLFEILKNIFGSSVVTTSGTGSTGRRTPRRGEGTDSGSESSGTDRRDRNDDIPNPFEDIPPGGTSGRRTRRGIAGITAENSIDAMLALNEIAEAQYNATLHTNELLAELNGMMGNNGRVDVFLVKDNNIVQTSKNELEEVDRNLIERLLTRARSRGVK